MFSALAASRFIHQIVAFFNRSAIESDMSTLGLILVILLAIVLFGGGLGYRGGYGDSPYYGYGIGGIGLVLVILLILALVGRL